MALSEMILGYLGEQTPAGPSVPKVEFRGGGKVQCIESGRIGYIARGCCGGVKENERLIEWGFEPGSCLMRASVLKVSNLRLLEKVWP